MSDNEQPTISNATLVDNQVRLVDTIQRGLLDMQEAGLAMRDLREGHSALSMAIDKLASLRGA
jgi:hypothetical protein